MRGDTDCCAINDSRRAKRNPIFLQEKPLRNVMGTTVYNEGLNICMFLCNRKGMLDLAAVLKNIVISILLNIY